MLQKTTSRHFQQANKANEQCDSPNNIIKWMKAWAAGMKDKSEP